MNIIALMPATEAYEVLLRNWGGYSGASCCVWQEDSQHNFITFIPPNVPLKNNAYYCFSCATFDGMEKWGADLRNGILTYHTIDNTTTYWVDLGVTNPGDYTDTNEGGYNKDTCFHVYGGPVNEAELTEAPYEECQKIRDSK
ncbi:15180_t:CDS:2 [Funneliformis geosporum]|uniref:15180_t:CDS:1 n=1 Tax=Funneliformis geosporum TaxID=1117311 RepID=A0A9W4WYC4_9GLOM|nr:15180_t:CDS:2 [Funneliformis geosporum]